MKKAQIKRTVRDALDMVADRVITHKDGTFTARHTYFYRHGQTADKFADEVAAAIADANFRFTQIDLEDHWAQWPKDSYFQVRFRVASRESENLRFVSHADNLRSIDELKS